MAANNNKETKRVLNMTAKLEFGSDDKGFSIKVILTEMDDGSSDPNDKLTLELDMNDDEHRAEFRNILEISDNDPEASYFIGYQKNGKFQALGNCDMSKAFSILDEYGNRKYGDKVFTADDSRMEGLKCYLYNVNQVKEHSMKIANFDEEIKKLQTQRAIYKKQLDEA